MTDPKSLHENDRIRFVARPREWSQSGYYVHEDTVRFMDELIARGRSCSIQEIDEHGYPWIEARLKDEEGVEVTHWWCITEESGWVRV